MSRLSRRSMLGFGALAGVGGIVGAAPAVAAAAPAAAPAGRALTLQGRALRRSGTGKAAVGDVRTVSGLVSDGTRDGQVFHTVHVVSKSTDADDVVAVESQLFVFTDGTLAGSGTVTRAGRGTFVVTGGTGRFAGARGSYTTQQSADAAGGGTATYTVDLTTDL